MERILRHSPERKTVCSVRISKLLSVDLHLGIVAIPREHFFLYKTQSHEIFECWFFHQLASPGPNKGTGSIFKFFRIFMGILG